MLLYLTLSRRLTFVHTGAEVDVHQHGSEVVGVDDEVAHTLIAELWTLHVWGPGRRCHPVNTRRFQNKTQAFKFNCYSVKVCIQTDESDSHNCRFLKANLNPVSTFLPHVVRNLTFLDVNSTCRKLSVCGNIRAHKKVKDWTFLSK